MVRKDRLVIKKRVRINQIMFWHKKYWPIVKCQKKITKKVSYLPKIWDLQNSVLNLLKLTKKIVQEVGSTTSCRQMIKIYTKSLKKGMLKNIISLKDKALAKSAIYQLQSTHNPVKSFNAWRRLNKKLIQVQQLIK